MDINSLIDKLNPEFVLELMKLGSCITIPCNESLEQNWGELGLKGLTAQNNIELSLFGGGGCTGSKYYFPLSTVGMSDALAFAEAQVCKFVNQ